VDIYRSHDDGGEGDDGAVISNSHFEAGCGAVGLLKF